MKRTFCLLLAIITLILSFCAMTASAEEKIVIEMAVSGSAQELALR